MGTGKLLSTKKRWRQYARRHTVIARVSSVLSVTTMVFSVVTLVVLMYYIGFDHAENESATIRGVLRVSQGVFTAAVLFNLIFNFRETTHRARVLKWIVDAGMLLALLPWIYPRPEQPWIVWLEQLLYSNIFLFSVLSLFSIVELCYGLIRVLGRRVNPSLLLGLSFIFVIILGSFLLMMPRCTHNGISYIDSLFVSGSAVCITGLTPVDVATTFTPLGQLVLAVMFEVGGLGIMTFTCFFALFFSGNSTIYSQLIVRDIVYSKSMRSLVPTLLYVLGFTIVIEAIGAVLLYVTVPDTLGMTTEGKLAFSMFHSASAFCNAGFSTVEGGMANPVLMGGNQWFYVALSLLILAGGIGFPILVNVKDALVYHARRVFSRIVFRQASNHRRAHVYDLNTKLVLVTSITILVVCSIAFFVLESGNTMRGMDAGTRVVQSVFNSLTPRSAGFVSLNPALFLNVTLVMVLVQMWIGGASQSMAGGVKVNTVAIMLLNVRTVARGNSAVNAFNRNISRASVRRANAVVTLSIVTTLACLVLVMMFDPGLPLRSAFFEVVSAVFTVGSSLGVTGALSVGSKLTLTVAMFLGRVGLISLMTGMFTPAHDTTEHLPDDNVIIN